MRLLGPNCLGVTNRWVGLNATFAQTIARPGNVAFLSQSGALQTDFFDWSLREQVGFSAFVSTGSMLDIGWGDVIDCRGDDAATQSILNIYMESIDDTRAFLSAAREVTLTKPIIQADVSVTQEHYILLKSQKEGRVAMKRLGRIVRRKFDTQARQKRYSPRKQRP